MRAITEKINSQLKMQLYSSETEEFDFRFKVIMCFLNENENYRSVLLLFTNIIIM